ncbi:PA14 domain-containing protein [Peribacillus sp. NPDC046944]|uniref:PA14 domain-containing protein n=1 Tax=unclassified Peribacillus TaxID=2675266 RepID=UPI003D003D77
MVGVVTLGLVLFSSGGFSGTTAEASSGKWSVTYYPKLNFKGTAVKKTVSDINFAWGTKSPAAKIPVNKFSAKLTKTLTVKEGAKYRISGKANDGVRVYVNGKKKVDYWKDGSHSFKKDLMLAKGDHKVEVQYYDQKGNAYLNADVEEVPETIPTDKWTGLFFPSSNFTGTPVSTTASNLKFSWGSKAPVDKIAKGTYSAIYQKKVVVKKDTKYVLMGKANDGVRIYVDGVRKVNEWKNGTRNFEKNLTLKKGTHTIKVEYYNKSGSAQLQVDLKESEKVTPLERWAVTLYGNQDLTGNKVYQSAATLDYDWGTKKPATGIPTNHFSAIFEKRTKLTSTGTYILSGGANDGIRVYVDGTKKVDQWKNGTHPFNIEMKLDAGIHVIKVEYYDNTGFAKVEVDLKEKSNITRAAKTGYNVTLDSALSKQMSTNPQTDKKYEAFIPASSVKLASTKTSGTTKEKVNIITTDSRKLGSLSKNAKVTIQDNKTIDKKKYYKIVTGWVSASKADTKYYMDPSNFTKSDTSYYQFAKLSMFSALNESEINQKILQDKGILKDQAKSFLEAGFKYGVNEIYLISHANLETGRGSSRLAKGIKVKTKKDSKGNIVYAANKEKEIVVLADDAKDYEAKVYNMYGIGAYDSCALECGARRAFNEGWTTPSKAIVEGAQFAAENYIYAGQDTLYKMRWNPDQLVEKGYATHQYASDIGWAVKQTKNYVELYSLLNSYTVVYDVPSYK